MLRLFAAILIAASVATALVCPRTRSPGSGLSRIAAKPQKTSCFFVDYPEPRSSYCKPAPG